VEITTETTEQDHNDFSREYSIKRKWLQRLLILMVVDALLAVVITVSSFYLVNFIFIGILLFPFFFGIPYFLAKKRMREVYERSPAPNGEKTYKPFASGIEITDETTTTFLRHEDIKQIGRSGNFVFIITRHTGYYLLPIWCFESHEQIAHFLRVVTTGTAHVKGRQPRAPLTFKPIYLIGILCFIPLIGFFAGLVLLILGLAHYKDRVFVVMGVIGMLFTIAIYSSLFYFTFNSGIVADGFASIAQSEVNDLVKNIEFYKLQNGAYPDSLQQLDTKDSFTNIYDPLPAFEAGKKAVPFQYERKGPKYLLFSVGKDGKPNTADDIYPTLTNADTSKLGFMRKP
jgi:Type II secretion system (T2SS), protein G